MRPSAFASTMLSLVLPLTVPARAAAAQEAPPDDVIHAGLDDLAERWEAAARELGVPGFAVVVVTADEVLHRQTFGLRDVERGLPVTADTAFYIASATKPFVATGVLQLVADGEVELDAPVKRYLPHFELADAAAAEAITVRDLLCHRPGINSFPIVFLDAYTGEITEDRYWHWLTQVEPLGRVDYTNVHFTLAGRIVESASGMPWRDFLAARVFEPLGLERTTGYADTMYAWTDVALPTLWTSDGFVAAPVRKTDATMHAAGGLGTSIRDAGRWLRVQLGGGAVDGARVLPERLHAEMLAEQSRFAQPDGWLRKMEGFGLGWQRGTYRGERYCQHGGGYVGSAAHFSFLPDAGYGVAVLANTDDAGQALCSVVSIDVYDRVLDDASGYDPLPGFREGVVRAHANPRDPAPEGEDPVAAGRLSRSAEAYVGTYASPEWGTFTVALEEGRMVARLGQIELAVLAGAEPDAFRVWAPRTFDAQGVFEGLGETVEAVVLEARDLRLRFER